jgi:hypothetical protein
MGKFMVKLVTSSPIGVTAPQYIGEMLCDGTILYVGTGQTNLHWRRPNVNPSIFAESRIEPTPAGYTVYGNSGIFDDFGITSNITEIFFNDLASIQFTAGTAGFIAAANFNNSAKLGSNDFKLDLNLKASASGLAGLIAKGIASSGLSNDEWLFSSVDGSTFNFQYQGLPPIDIFTNGTAFDSTWTNVNIQRWGEWLTFSIGSQKTGIKLPSINTTLTTTGVDYAFQIGQQFTGVTGSVYLSSYFLKIYN